MSRAAYLACLLALAAAALLAVGGCGGGGDGGSASSMSVDDVLAEVDGLEGKARADKLRALADEAGGELNLYTSMSIDLAALVADAFEDAYDLDVSVYKTGDSLTQRLAEEQKAGYRGGDVVEMSGHHFPAVSEAGALQPYRSPAAKNLLAGSTHEDWTADRLNVFVVARNVDAVPPDEAPKTWEDLADPRWKGKLVMNNDDPEWFVTLQNHLVQSGKTPAEADALLAAIAKNATFVSSNSLARELLAAGEFDLAMSIRHTVEGEMADGAPIDWQPAIEPLMWKPDGLAMISDPLNPAAAMLFIDWLLGDGQKVFAQAKTDPLRKDLLVAPSVPQIPVDIDDYLANEEEWLERYEEFVRAGTQGD